MKKFLLLIAIFSFSLTAVWAQKSKVTTAITLKDQKDLDGAKDAIELAMSHEKSIAWPKTWMVAGQIYASSFEQSKKGDEILSAYDYFEKAIDLDAKGDAKGRSIGKYKKEITNSMILKLPLLTNSAIYAFEAKDFKGALTSFEKVLHVDTLPNIIEIQGEKADTAIIYNTAISAYNAEVWDKAIKYFNLALDYKYSTNGKGDAVLLLQQIYTSTGDSVKMGENLKRGFELYPDDERILNQLINFNLSSGKTSETLTYLNKAIEVDSSNSSYLFARGVLRINSGDQEGGMEDYNKCLAVDENHFNALYNIGVIYFNEGVEEMKVADEEANYKKYEVKKAAANKTFRKALPYFEKAHKVDPKDRAVMESLKGLYYRFEMNDKFAEMDKAIKALY